MKIFDAKQHTDMCAKIHELDMHYGGHQVVPAPAATGIHMCFALYLHTYVLAYFLQLSAQITTSNRSAGALWPSCFEIENVQKRHTWAQQSVGFQI
jgi:hypothetical protein